MSDNFEKKGHELEQLLATCARMNASDLHLVPGLAAHFRWHGELRPLNGATILTSNDTRQLAAQLISMASEAGHGSDSLEKALGTRGAYDGAITSAKGVRFRFNVFKRQTEIAVALRRLEDHFRTLQELGLPESLYRLCDLRDGLVVVSGPTGSGKSTTLATLIDSINRARTGHIITIEDPIEYLHKPRMSIINQRQIGLDAPSFNEALVDSLRQDPDVILVGEVRDLATIRTAIIAAETGHLVFTTLHAGDCVGAIERLIAVFPADEQEGIRRQLALVLKAVVAQHLLVNEGDDPVEIDTAFPCVAASEILMVTPAVANLIATGKSTQIYSAMEAGSAFGMQTLEHDLARLLGKGKISDTAALALARNPEIVRDRAAMPRNGVSSFEKKRNG